MSDVSFTADEEARITALFGVVGALELTPGWQDRLAERIAAESSHPAGAAPNLNDQTAPIPILDSTNVPEEPSVPRAHRSQRILQMAAAVAAVALMFGALRFVQTPSDGPTVIDSASQIPTPSRQPVTMPEDVQLIRQTSTGDLVGATKTRGDEPTQLFLSDDGANWTPIATLPISQAMIDVSGPTWVAAGGDTASTRLSAEVLEPTQLATQIVVHVSQDQGSSWEQIHYSPAPSGLDFVSFTPVVSSLGVTTDGRVYLAVSPEADTDFTTPARSLSLIGPADRVLRTSVSDFEARPYSVGPDTIGPLDPDALSAESLGLTEDQYRDLQTGADAIAGVEASQPLLLESVGGARFTSLAIPQRGSDNWLVPPELRVVGNDVFASRFRPSGLDIWQLDAAGEWTVGDRDVPSEVLVDRGVWQIVINPFAETGLRQSLDGGENFVDIPMPRRASFPLGVTPTIGGGAVVWTQSPTQLLSFDGLNFTENGYRFEWSDDGAITVTRDGSVVVDAQRFSTEPGTNLLRDVHENIILIDPETGAVLATVDLDERSKAYAQTGPASRNPTTLFFSWSSDGTDWKFAELSELGPGVWDAVAVGEEGDFFAYDTLHGNPERFIVRLPVED